MDNVEQIAKEISLLVPRLIRGMHVGFRTPHLLTPAQLTVLIVLHEQGITSSSNLSKALRVSAPTITGLVDRLERSHYLKRFHDDKDRRVINIQITKKGEAQVSSLRGMIRNKWKSILVHLEPRDRQIYLAILKKILQVLERENA